MSDVTPGSPGWAAQIRALSEADPSPRRVALFRVADAIRACSTAWCSRARPNEVIEAAAADLEAVAERFSDYTNKSIYEGFAESANAGEPFGFFDHSPMLGRANPLAPPIRLWLEGDQMVGTATFGAAYEGPPGCVHGGYVAAAFDEVLGSTQSLSGSPGMTGRLTVNYRSPTPLETELRFVGLARARRGPQDLHAGRAVGRRPAVRGGRGPVHLDPAGQVRRPQGRARPAPGRRRGDAGLAATRRRRTPRPPGPRRRGAPCSPETIAPSTAPADEQGLHLEVGLAATAARGRRRSPRSGTSPGTGTDRGSGPATIVNAVRALRQVVGGVLHPGEPGRVDHGAGRRRELAAEAVAHLERARCRRRPRGRAPRAGTASGARPARRTGPGRRRPGRPRRRRPRTAARS